MTLCSIYHGAFFSLLKILSYSTFLKEIGDDVNFNVNMFALHV